MLRVPLEGEPGQGHGVKVVLGVPDSGGAEVDLLGGVEWPLAGKGVGTTSDGPRPLARPPAALDPVAPEVIYLVMLLKVFMSVVL